MEHTIIINGRSTSIQDSELTFDQLTNLVRQQTEGTGLLPIVYSHGPDGNREGSLCRGEAIKVHDGMVFSAVVTGNA